MSDSRRVYTQRATIADRDVAAAALAVWNSLPSVFEKTCEATQKNVKSHVF